MHISIKLIPILLLVLLCFGINNAQIRFSESNSKAIQGIPENTQLYRSIFRGYDTPIDIQMSGYVKTDAFWQTRQIVSLQEGNILLLPAEPIYDIYGIDEEAKGAYNIMPIETMMRFDFFGPEMNCMKISGAIEASFWGQTVLSFGNETPNLTINMLVMEHAYFQLDWPTFTFLAGQTTHPLCHDVPDTICYNTGMPITPFSYAPQLRFSYHAHKAELIFAMTSELNWESNGPFNFITQYIRNAIIPNLHAQARIKYNEHVETDFGVDIKKLVPRIATEKNIAVDEHIWSGAAFADIKLDWNPYSLLLKTVWAQNGVDYDLTGGYAVASIDPVTDFRTYTNFSTVSVYMDAKRSGKVEPGIYAGVIKNLGTSKPIIPSITVDDTTTSLVYDFAANTDTVWRISPRLRYNIEPIVIGAEVEYTGTIWGDITPQGTIINRKPAHVVRFEFGFYFYF